MRQSSTQSNSQLDCKFGFSEILYQELELLNSNYFLLLQPNGYLVKRFFLVRGAVSGWFWEAKMAVSSAKVPVTMFVSIDRSDVNMM